MSRRSGPVSVAVCMAVGVWLGAGVGSATAQGPTVFRISQIELRDPHGFAAVLFLCLDVTNSLNQFFLDSITLDADTDGLLDVSLLVAFRPLDQAAQCEGASVSNGACTFPVESSSCQVDTAGSLEFVTYSTLSAGSCLTPLAGTTSSYSPAISEPVGPCFVTDTFDFLFLMGGIGVPLQDVKMAATYVGDPAGTLVDGLIRGFMSEEDAGNSIIPLGVPVVGGLPISQVMPGGSGNCNAGDDRELGPDGVTMGWWVYFNFTAEEVPFPCTALADLDGDCDADAGDFEFFNACLSGPTVDPPDCGCERADFDGNGPVDLADFGRFQRNVPG